MSTHEERDTVFIMAVVFVIGVLVGAFSGTTWGREHSEHLAADPTCPSGDRMYAVCVPRGCGVNWSEMVQCYAKGGGK